MFYKAIFYVNEVWNGTLSTNGDFKHIWKQSHYELNEYRGKEDHAIMVYVQSVDDESPFISPNDRIICVASPERIMTKNKCLLIK